MSSIAKAKSPLLTRPPLLETSFEFRWELPQVPNTQIRRDPSYPLLYGRLYDRFKKEYSVTEDLPSVQVHPDGSPYTPRHRMRKGGEAIGAIQVGPGIITIHDAKGYSWNRFREEIVRVFEAFIDFYPQSTFPLNLLKTELRFVNGVITEGSENLLQFLTEKLHTKVELDPALFAPNCIQTKPDGIGVNFAFSIDEPVGKAMLAIGSGEMDEKPALIQQMFFHSLGESAPQDLGSLDPWLDAMHKIARNWFDTLYRGDLMKRFV